MAVKSALRTIAAIGLGACLVSGVLHAAPAEEIAMGTGHDAFTADPPQPRGRWVPGLADPPAALDPRRMEALPAEEDQGMGLLPDHVFVLAEAHYAYGCAAAPDGSIYFAEYNNRELKRVFPDGRIRRVLIKSELFGRGGLYGVAVDKSGTVYLGLDSDRKTGAILRIRPDGREDLVATGFNRPRQMVTDDAGNLFVVLESENRIIRWDAATGEVTTVVTQDECRSPQGVAIGCDGSVYFSEYGVMAPSVPEEHGLGNIAGVPLEAGRVRVKRPDGRIETLAGGFWRARGLALLPSGDLYLATEANAWDQSNSGLIVRITPDGHTERVVTGINYPQFPTATPDGRICTTLAMDNLLVAVDPRAEFERMPWPDRPEWIVGVHGGTWQPAGSETVNLRVDIQRHVLEGTVQPEGDGPVSIWIRIPAGDLDLYRGELPYTLPHFPTPGRYELPEVECRVANGICRTYGMPLRSHWGARWPMILGYQGPEPQFRGREWPAEGFSDVPEAYLVFISWRPQSSERTAQ